jgi:hypothetical protein
MIEHNDIITERATESTRQSSGLMEVAMPKSNHCPSWTFQIGIQSLCHRVNGQHRVPLRQVSLLSGEGAIRSCEASRAGRISAGRDEFGQWAIEPSINQYGGEFI